MQNNGFQAELFNKTTYLLFCLIVPAMNDEYLALVSRYNPRPNQICGRECASRRRSMTKFKSIKGWSKFFGYESSSLSIGAKFLLDEPPECIKVTVLLKPLRQKV